MSFPVDAKDSVSFVVSDFYDQYPFPGDPLRDGPPEGFNWRWCFETVYSYCTDALPGNAYRPLRILDAGCGTGVSTDYLSHQNPHSEILAIDISGHALEVAKERLRRSGGLNQSLVSFEQINLFSLEGADSFDFINSVGVLHHLQDPLVGLQVLESLLRPGGILHLFLYAKAGRVEIQHSQRALKAMKVGIRKDDIQLAKELFKGLPRENRLRKDYEHRRALECCSDIAFADMYLHPQETTFNIHELFSLFTAANLEFVSFSNPLVWKLERLLNGQLLERAKGLNRYSQYQLIEDLDPSISHFELFLSKGPLIKYDWREDDIVLSSTGKINPFLWGWPNKELHDSDMNRIELCSAGLELMETVERFPEMPFRLLPISMEKSKLVALVRDLQRKQVLLLYPL